MRGTEVRSGLASESQDHLHGGWQRKGRLVRWSICGVHGDFRGISFRRADRGRREGGSKGSERRIAEGHVGGGVPHVREPLRFAM